MQRVCGVVSLLTDFGSSDPYVGIMKGMVKRLHLGAQIVDLCHEVPPQDVEVGAFFLQAAIQRFPAGTVHVAVVDPGVGSERRILAATAHDCIWLAPDNGLLGPVLASAERAEVRVVDAERLGLDVASRTFHGRDVFAPVAGMLSSGRYGFSAVGRRIDDFAAPSLDETPRVLMADHFGNLITTITGASLDGRAVVDVGGCTIQVGSTYADVAPGELVALVNSYGLVEFAARDGRASDRLDLRRGSPVQLRDA